VAGIKLIQGGLFTDDRGITRFVNNFDFSNVKRFYQKESFHKGFVFAWHGHRKEAKYVYVARGAIKMGVVHMDNKEDMSTFILTSDSPSVLYIPANYYNGFKTLTENTVVIFYSTSTLEQSQEDDVRLPWDTYGSDFWEVRYK